MRQATVLTRIGATLLWTLVAGAAAGAIQPGADGDSAVERANEAFGRRDYEQAAAFYREALDEEAGTPLLHYRLGYSLHALGRVEEALAHHVRGAGATGGPIRRACLYNAACACARLGQDDDALGYLQQSIDAGFVDTALAASDSELDTLRADPRFQSVIAGIGQTPTLHQQADFLLGTWELRGENGERLGVLRVERPHQAASAILTTWTAAQGSYAMVGLLTPNAQDRTWEWVEVDDIGTTIRRSGWADGRSLVLEGPMSGPTGDVAMLRITRRLEADGRLFERAESSWDGGASWGLHHEEFFTRVASDGAAEASPARGR